MSKYLKGLSQKGILHIQSTRNNTLVTLTDLQGNTKISTSAGTIGFRNARKSTPYAAGAACERIVHRALDLGFSGVSVKLRGLGYGKESVIKTLSKSKLTITKISERTPTPHNGCRAPKKRRV